MAEELADAIASIGIARSVDGGQALLKLAFRADERLREAPVEKIEELVGLEAAAGDVCAADKLNPPRVAPSYGEKVEELLGSMRRPKHTKKQKPSLGQTFCAPLQSIQRSTNGQFVQDEGHQSKQEEKRSWVPHKIDHHEQRDREPERIQKKRLIAQSPVTIAVANFEQTQPRQHRGRGETQCQQNCEYGAPECLTKLANQPHARRGVNGDVYDHGGKHGDHQRENAEQRPHSTADPSVVCQ